MTKFKNGDLVEIDELDKAVVVDATPRRFEDSASQDWIGVIELEGPLVGVRYAIRETVLRLVEER